jgi:deoxyhypusine synthase
MSQKEERNPEQYGDGKSEQLEVLKSLDINEIQSFSDLLKAMERTSFGGRSLGEAAKVLVAMIEDDDCLVVGTFSGAMTIAKMGLVICDMIEKGMLNAIISTGALMAHGFVEATGMTHFKYKKEIFANLSA